MKSAKLSDDRRHCGGDDRAFHRCHEGGHHDGCQHEPSRRFGFDRRGFGELFPGGGLIEQSAPRRSKANRDVYREPGLPNKRASRVSGMHKIWATPRPGPASLPPPDSRRSGPLSASLDQADPDQAQPHEAEGGHDGLLSMSSTSVGNDFQQPRGNQGFRHFHMSSTSTPYGRPAYAERRRPTRAVGAETTAGSVVSSR
jgi:hypothetical protein